MSTYPEEFSRLEKERDKLQTENQKWRDEELRLLRRIEQLIIGERKLKEDLKEAEDALSDSVKLFAKTVEKHRWIPVTERLPEDSGYYQVIREQNGWPTTRVFHAGNRQQWESSDIVTHWKEIILTDKD